MPGPSLICRACGLAWKDYRHEGLLSLCNILALAAVLTPLLVLYGVKFGVITTLSERLLRNPQNMEISPVASGQYSQNFLRDLAAMPQVAFVLPRTRALSATMELLRPGAGGKVQRVSLEPTAPGDPLVTRFGAAMPPYSLPLESARSATTGATGAMDSTRAMDPTKTRGPIPIILSEEAARKMGIAKGQELEGRVDRLQRGRAQRVSVALTVVAVLPLEAQQKDVAFVPLPLLEATEAYRDGRSVPALGWPGEDPPPEEERLYPSFRLYTRTLEDVAPLRQYFLDQQIEVYTRAEEIAAVQQLDKSLTLIFGLIGAAAGLGFVASTASSTLAAVKRKERVLGLVRLCGYPTRAIMAFPLFQTLLTGLFGTAFAALLYSGTALLINRLFASSLVTGVPGAAGRVCALEAVHLAMALGLVLGLSLLASLQPAARAARIEPSEVIRDV